MNWYTIDEFISAVKAGEIPAPSHTAEVKFPAEREIRFGYKAER